MLEWTNKKISKQNKNFCSLADAYDDLINERPEEDITTIIPSPKEMKAELIPLLEVLGLKNISLNLHTLTPINPEIQYECYQQFRKNCPRFLKILGTNCQEECLTAGLTEKNIAKLARGLCPENYTIHLKIPLDFGGMPSISNFALVKTHPTHDNLHQIIDLQLENNFALEHGQIYIPTFSGAIYND